MLRLIRNWIFFSFVLIIFGGKVMMNNSPSPHRPLKQPNTLNKFSSEYKNLGKSEASSEHKNEF